MAELADALDSKSSDRKIVWVRAPPPANFLQGWVLGVQGWTLKFESVTLFRCSQAIQRCLPTFFPHSRDYPGPATEPVPSQVEGLDITTIRKTA